MCWGTKKAASWICIWIVKRLYSGYWVCKRFKKDLILIEWDFVCIHLRYYRRVCAHGFWTADNHPDNIPLNYYNGLLMGLTVVLCVWVGGSCPKDPPLASTHTAPVTPITSVIDILSIYCVPVAVQDQLYCAEIHYPSLVSGSDSCAWELNLGKQTRFCWLNVLGHSTVCYMCECPISQNIDL